MKRLVLLFLCLFTLLAETSAQYQSLKWDWFQEADSTGYQIVHDIAIDKVNGFVYAVGGFDNNLSINFGGDVSYGARDGFVSKFDTLGNLQWSFHIGGAQNDEIMAIDIDYTNDNILVTGYCEASNVNFKGVSGINQISNLDRGGKDVLVATYDFNGAYVWNQREGGAGDDIGNDILYIPRLNPLNPSRFIYTGIFNDQMELISNAVDFGPNDNNDHMFIASRFLENQIPIFTYSFDWRAYTEGDYQEGLGLAINGERLHVSGNFRNTIKTNVFNGGAPISTTTISSNTSVSNIFNMKFNVIDGIPLNIFTILSPGSDTFGAINVKEGKLYIGGSVSNNVRYGNSAIDNGVLGQEAFVSIHDLNNNESFITRIKEPNLASSTRSIVHSIDFTDSLLVIGGRTNGTIRFDNNSSNDLTDQGNNTDGFVALYNSNNIFCERHEIDGSGTNAVYSVKGRGKDVFVGGAFGNTANLGNSLVMNSQDNDAGFISLLSLRDCKPAFSYLNPIVCNESTPFLPSSIADTIGYFSQVGNGLVIDSLTGQVTPFVSAGGLHQIVYTTFKGCSDTFDLTINLGSVPNFNSKPNDTIYTSSSNCQSAPYTYTLPTYINDCGSATLYQIGTPLNGSAFPIGTTEQVFVLSDGYNPNDTVRFNIVVEDNIAPTISCPTDSLVFYSANNNCEALVQVNLNGNDNCSSSPTISQIGGNTNYLNGGFFPVSTLPYNLIFNATDNSGNVSTNCTVKVYVIDTIKPVIKNCPQLDTTIYSSAGNCSALVNLGHISGVDSCTITSSFLNLDGVNVTSLINTFSLDTTVVIYTAIDNSNNSSTCSFNLIVKDTIKPVIKNCPQLDTTIYSSAGNCSALVNLGHISGVDSCTITSSFLNLDGFNVTSLINTFSLDTTVVIYTAIDNSNNSSTCSFNLIVRDTIVPVFTNCNTGDTIKHYVTENNCSKKIEFLLPEATDNCDFRIFQDAGFLSGSNLQLGNDSVVFKVEDSSGNFSECRVIYSLIDTIAPILDCPNDITLSANIQTCGAEFIYSDFTGVDNCSLSLTPAYQIDVTGFSSGSIFPLGTTTLSYQQEDFSGNSGTCSFNVTVENNVILGFDGMPVGVCNDATPFDLYPYILDTNQGLFNGVGVYNNVFYPDSVQNNTEITYVVGVGNCKDSISQTVIIHDFVPNAGDSISICGLEVMLNANTVIGADGEWLQINNETYSPFSSDNNAIVSELNQGSYFYIWELTKDNCIKSDTVYVTFFEQPLSFAGENVTVEIDEVILEAEEGIGQGYWTVLNSTGIIQDSTYYNTTVNGLNLGLNTFIWTVTNGPCPSDSSIVRVFYDKLTLPNAFTPNGDGVNDVFKIEGFELYSDATLTILDRWGELIFFTDQSDEYWDGTYKGRAVVEDTYFYILFINGEEFTGYIELRR